MKCACGRDAETGIATYGLRPFIAVCGYCARAIAEDMQTGGEPEYCSLPDLAPEYEHDPWNGKEAE